MESGTMGRVVVGVSATVAGYQALRFATSQARQRGSVLIAVRVVPRDQPTNGFWRELNRDITADAVRAAFAEALGGVPADVTVQIRTEQGGPARALIDVANRVDDLLVVGGSRRRRFRLRRTVASNCARRATCPVVVVPPPFLAKQQSATRLARAAVRDAERLLRTAGNPPAAA